MPARSAAHLIFRLVEQPLPDRLISGLAAFEAGDAAAESLVEWAVAALVAGHDSATLRVLAGLLPGEADGSAIAAYARRAARELEVEMPEGEALCRAYISVACRALLHGELAPEVALDRIHRWVVSPLGHPRDLMRWCYLWEGNGPDCEFLDVPNTEYVLAEARRWVAAEPGAAA